MIQHRSRSRFVLIFVVALLIQIDSQRSAQNTCTYFTTQNRVICTNANDPTAQGPCIQESRGQKSGFQIGICMKKVEDQQILFIELFDKIAFSFYDLRITYDKIKQNRVLHGNFDSIKQFFLGLKEDNFKNVNILGNGALVYKVSNTKSITLIAKKRQVDSTTYTLVRRINELTQSLKKLQVSSKEMKRIAQQFKNQLDAHIANKTENEQISNRIKSQVTKLDDKINQKCSNELKIIKQKYSLELKTIKQEIITPKYTRIWGINFNNDVITIGWGETEWKKISSQMKYVSVGYEGKVWGISVNQDIFNRNGVEGNWVQIPGSLKQIQAGKKDTVWGVNRHDNIVQRHFHLNWELIQGGLKFVSFSPHGTTLGVNINNQVFRRTQGSNWQYIDGLLCTQVSIGLNDEAWCISPQNTLYMMVRNGFWISVSSPKFKYVKITHTGSVWAIGIDDKIYVKHRFQNTWIPFPGSLVQISVY